MNELNLGSRPLNPTNIDFQDDGNDRYTFIAPDLQTARELGFEVGRQIADEGTLEGLKNPAPIDSYRLDGLDTRYSEEIITNDNDEVEGVEVQIYLGDYAGKEPFSSKLREAISSVMKRD